MPIEFRCDQCQKLLRTADDTAGKSAKCPSCGQIQTIPIPAITQPEPRPPAPIVAERVSPEPGSPFDDSAASASRLESDNPYQSPEIMSTPGASGFRTAARGPIVPTKIVLGDLLSNTWELFKVHWGICFLVSLAYMAVFGILGIVGIVAVGVIGNLAGDIPGVIAMGCLMLLGGLTTIWLTCGYIRVLLQCGRGESVLMGDLFRGGACVARCLGAGLLFALIVFGVILAYGAVAAVVGVVCARLMPPAQVMVVTSILMILVYFLVIATIWFLGLVLGWFHYLIIDQNAGAVDSLRLSREIMIGNKGTIFLAFLVVNLIANALSSLTCGIGGLAAMPFMMLLSVTAYLMATGQPLAVGAYQAAPNPIPQGPSTSPFAPRDSLPEG